MAHISKHRSGWRVQIERNGVRRSQVFETKAAASAWAVVTEAEILAEKRSPFPRKSFAQAMQRYSKEVSVTKKGARSEKLRLDALIRDFPAVASKLLVDVTTADLAGWRDARLEKVTKGSVQRDLNILSHLFTVAIDEWKWLRDNPIKGLRAPGENPPRTRRIDPMEIRRIARWCGYRTGVKPDSKTEEVGLCWMLALRTGMRAGELLSLSGATVDLDRGVARILLHKTLHVTGKPREVPLSGKAIRMLRPVLGSGKLFTLTSASLDVLFRKARDSLLIKDLHFHDARADALTRFAKHVDAMTLARISGHRDLRVLMDHYYRTTAEQIASRLLSRL